MDAAVFERVARENHSVGGQAIQVTGRPSLLVRRLPLRFQIAALTQPHQDGIQRAGFKPRHPRKLVSVMPCAGPLRERFEQR